jgi:hypothetical protein
MDKKNIKFWILGSILLTIAVGSTLPFLFAKANLAAVTEKLKKEGMPITPREFADKYYKPIPEEQNALQVFDAACPLIDNKTAGDRLVFQGLAAAPRHDQEIAPLLLAPVEEYVRKNRDFFNEMDKIRKYDRIYINYEWEKGHALLLPRINKVRNAVRTYAVKTELAIKRNDPQQAEEILKTMFHIDKLAGQNPFIIGQVVFYACDAITLARLERGMNTLDFTPDQLKSFEQICSEHEQDIIRQYPYSWKVELSFLLDFAPKNMTEDEEFFSPYKSNPHFNELPKKYRIAFYYYSGDLLNDIASNAEAYRKAMDIPLDIYLKRKPLLEKVNRERSGHGNCIIFSGDTIRFYSKAMEAIARLRCAKTACAIERFRLKHGKLPEKLEELVPEFLSEVPIDPFDGKKLRYVRGSFDVRYEIPLNAAEVKLKREQEKKSGMFGAGSPKVNHLEYKNIVLKKKGFYVYSIGSDLKDDKAENLWERRLKDVIFVVLDKKKVKTNGQKKH